MATAGPVGDMYEVEITLDSEIFGEHTVTITPTEIISVFTDLGVPAPNGLTLTFDDTNWDTPQIIQVIGNTEGTYPLPCVVKSTYYQRLGELKEEEDEALLTFYAEPSEGFIGNICGVVGWNSGISSGIVADGNFRLRMQNAVIGSIVTIVKTVNVYGLIFVRIKVVKPDASIVWLQNPTNGIVQYTMALAGTYNFYFYEQLIVAEILSNNISSIPSHNYVYKKGLFSSPDVGSTSIQINMIIYRKIHYKSIGTGVLNTFSHQVSGLIVKNLCGALTMDDVAPSSYLYFIGSTSSGGDFVMDVSGYFVAGNGIAGHNWGPFYISGVNVRVPASQIQLLKS